MLETPRQLAARFERGEMDRSEFQSLMALHARELIGEIEEEHQNPFAAWLESRRAKAVAKKLLRKNSPLLIREILTALADAPGFPMASYLWNASHPEVPLHCFFRIGKAPFFQILEVRQKGPEVVVKIEFLEEKNRREITLKRDDRWQLRAPSFATGEDKG